MASPSHDQVSLPRQMHARYKIICKLASRCTGRSIAKQRTTPSNQFNEMAVERTNAQKKPAEMAANILSEEVRIRDELPFGGELGNTATFRMLEEVNRTDPKTRLDVYRRILETDRNHGSCTVVELDKDGHIKLKPREALVACDLNELQIRQLGLSVHDPPETIAAAQASWSKLIDQATEARAKLLAGSGTPQDAQAMVAFMKETLRRDRLGAGLPETATSLEVFKQNDQDWRITLGASPKPIESAYLNYASSALARVIDMEGKSPQEVAKALVGGIPPLLKEAIGITGDGSDALTPAGVEKIKSHMGYPPSWGPVDVLMTLNRLSGIKRHLPNL
jgi:hypothetical protein